MSQEMAAHCRDQLTLGEDQVMIQLLGRWPHHNTRRLVSSDSGSPRGEVVGHHPERGIVALFDASEVLAYCIRKTVFVNPFTERM